MNSVYVALIYLIFTVFGGLLTTGDVDKFKTFKLSKVRHYFILYFNYTTIQATELGQIRNLKKTYLSNTLYVEITAKLKSNRLFSSNRTIIVNYCTITSIIARYFVVQSVREIMVQ